MLKKFEVTNYKNFKDKIEIDFSKVGGYQFNPNCITENLISKMLVYGRNATGKTNLGKALLDITNVVIGSGVIRLQNGMFLNADSKDTFAQFSYTFLFDDTEIKYEYKKVNDYQLLDEELCINEELAFAYNFVAKEGQFNLGVLEADTADVRRYIQADISTEEEALSARSLPFLRWLINNAALKEGSVLLQLDDFIRRMSLLAVGNATLRRSPLLNEAFYDVLDKDDNLKDFETFLNIMGVECKLRLIMLPEGQKELYFDHDKPVLFYETASSGTLALTSLYRRLLMGKEASLLYVDEFDAFYHYEMSEKMIMYFKERYPKCQLILTTHNTNLMTNKIMRPDCLFILSRKGKLTALCDATERELREGHNLEKLYISGEFEQYE